MTQKRQERIVRTGKKDTVRHTTSKYGFVFSDDVRDWYTTTKKTDRERVNEIKDWE